MAAEPGLTLAIYTAEPGSASEERLGLLGSWAASDESHSTGLRPGDEPVGSVRREARWPGSS